MCIPSKASHCTTVHACYLFVRPCFVVFRGSCFVVCGGLRRCCCEVWGRLAPHGVYLYCSVLFVKDSMHVPAAAPAVLLSSWPAYIRCCRRQCRCPFPYYVTGCVLHAAACSSAQQRAQSLAFGREQSINRSSQSAYCEARHQVCNVLMLLAALWLQR